MSSNNYVKSVMYDEDKKSGLKRAMSPFYLLSKLYGFGINLRDIFYKKGIFKENKIDSYVISVGNIVVGGTGKTPTVIYVAELLARHGMKVCILCRGYKGSNASKYLEVSNDRGDIHSDPATAGDEPYLLATKLKGIPVIVGKDRYIAGEYAVAKFKPDVCILDDGFQHRRLKRDLDIVTFDGSVGFGNGDLLPSGILREPVSALSRAHIIIINKGIEKSKDIISQAHAQSEKHHIFFCGYDIAGLNSWQGGNVDISYLSGKRILVFSALANASYFYKIVSRLGGSICEQLEFIDHHDYSIDDFLKIVKLAHDSSSDLVLTTEKDIVKFNKEWGKTSSVNIFSLDVKLKPLSFEDMFEI